MDQMDQMNQMADLYSNRNLITITSNNYKLHVINYCNYYLFKDVIENVIITKFLVIITNCNHYFSNYIFQAKNAIFEVDPSKN